MRRALIARHFPNRRVDAFGYGISLGSLPQRVQFRQTEYGCGATKYSERFADREKRSRSF